MRFRRDIQKEAEKAGLFDPPKQLEFETDGSVRTIIAQCPDCGSIEGPVEMTVFLADYSDEDCRVDLLLPHWHFVCPAFKHRFRRFRERLDRRILRLFRRQRTPWGIKHISWRPNWRPYDQA